MKKINYLLFIAIFFIIIFIYNCTKKIIIGNVGNEAITMQDIKYTHCIEGAYGHIINDEEALLIYIQKLIDVEIAKKINVSLEKKHLMNESERIDKNTKAPNIIKKIKNCFKNENEYLRVFIKPVLARREIEKKFFFDRSSFQKETFKKANNIKENFEKFIGDKKNDKNHYFRVDEKEKLFGSFNAFKINSQTQIVEDKFNYFIVRSVKKNSKIIAYEGFIVTKKDFNKFHNKEMEKINIMIKDKGLKGKLLNRIKGTQWEKIIK